MPDDWIRNAKPPGAISGLVRVEPSESRQVFSRRMADFAERAERPERVEFEVPATLRVGERNELDDPDRSHSFRPRRHEQPGRPDVGSGPAGTCSRRHSAVGERVGNEAAMGEEG